MTRKDYELIALVFKDQLKPFKVKPGHMGLDREDSNKVLGIERAACRLADVFKIANPRFNRKRFLEACTVEFYLDHYDPLPEDLQ